MPLWAISAASAVVLSITVLPPVFGPADEERALAAVHLQRERDHHHTARQQQRMPASSSCSGPPGSVISGTSPSTATA